MFLQILLTFTPSFGYLGISKAKYESSLGCVMIGDLISPRWWQGRYSDATEAVSWLNWAALNDTAEYRTGEMRRHCIGDQIKAF